MSDFVTFYLGGGIFNHLVTVGLALAASALVFHARSRDRGDARWLRLADRTLIVCVGFGLLGTLLGVIDAGAALAEIPPEHFQVAAARGAGFAVIPLTWALLGALPLAVVAGIHRHRASPVLAART
ncbi:hypothetical protein ACNOYE_03165 [Nannocystaceae bacterium ST9]